MASHVADPGLAESGAARIEWADGQMPVLRSIRERFEAERPLAGVRVAACLHVTAETANLVRALMAGGAETALCAANPLSTQDDTAAALVERYGAEVHAVRGEDADAYAANVAALVASGLLGRHPDLRIVLVECGFTWLPSFLWRMDKHWRSLGPEIPWVTEKPSETLRRQMRATTAPAQLGAATPQQVRELVDMIGAEWLLYASDHPHDHGPSGERLLAAVDDAARHAILAGNAAALYRLQ
jgi:predicted TIM-barrel fold metal-dependent hydrolase